jgi:hypothetical protein
MTKRFISVYLCLGLSLLLHAQVNPRTMPNKAYYAGENLKYLLHYGVINGGYAALSLTGEDLNGTPVYHAKAVGYTSGIVDKLFKVKDIYESYFNRETGLPKKALRNISEGNYKYYDEVLFDHASNSVSSTKSGVHKVPNYVHDIVSCFYSLRRMRLDTLKKGDVISFQTFFADDLFPFDVRYYGTETISTKLGDINCLKFVPIVEPGRIFKSKDDMTVWLSNDANFLPIMIKFDMIVGSFKCELIEYTNVRTPLKYTD